MIPGILYGFGSASSASALPVSVYCLSLTKTASRSLSTFILQAGSTVNKPGLAIYIPMSVVLIGVTSGNEAFFDAWFCICLVFTATIASVCAAPVANSGLVMTLIT